MNLQQAKKLNIPKNPGCYFFKDSQGRIIYIGKAAVLRSRVLSYFRERTKHSPAKFSMLKRIKTIEWEVVESEIEAMLLEVNLIKKYQPNYNIVMRDDKRHIYIKISTEEEWPRIFTTRKIDKTGRYFGPFVSVEAVKETLKVLRRLWAFRTCKTLPKKACLYYRIGKCPGMCEFEVSKREYNKILKYITMFLKGEKGKIVKDYEREINEIATSLRLLAMTTVVKDENENRLRLMKYRLLNMKKVLAHSNVLSLMDKYKADVVELAKVLGLPKVPERIEGYDISNIFGQESVGSMVVFRNGEASKGDYRKFKIRTEKEGDVWMLKEVLERRLKNRDKWELPDLMIIDGAKAQLNAVLRVLKKEKIEIPVLAISKGEGLRSSKAPDKIFFPGEKKALELPLSSPALHIIKRVRDESHRFAIAYHRKLKRERMFR